MKRYFFRELLPRTIVLTLVVWLILPWLPIGFTFNGGVLAALVFGAALTAGYVAVGQVVFGLLLNKLVKRYGERVWMMIFALVLMLSTSGGFVFIAAVVVPGIVSAGSWLAIAVSAVALTLGCMLTHDYGASEKASS